MRGNMSKSVFFEGVGHFINVVGVRQLLRGIDFHMESAEGSFVLSLCTCLTDGQTCECLKASVSYVFSIRNRYFTS